MTTPLVPTPTDPRLTGAALLRGRPVGRNIDVFGLTDRGRVRASNEDEFLVASLHKTMHVHHTSLPSEALVNLTSESTGYLLLVADGVGGAQGGEIASEAALSSLAQYATHTMQVCYTSDPAQVSAFLSELQKTVLSVHDILRNTGAGLATTLTMVVVMWPRAYVVHVGDSRCYRLRNGQLELLTKDQTMAQALVDAGVLSAADAATSRWKHVLSSALGANEAMPMATPYDCQWDDRVLLCSDGLTNHVSDDEIAIALREGSTAEGIVRGLVALALERGGSDNVTVVAGRLER
ncbi:MAG: protein phosphatase 2C domain-containing protein [Gemmatimonadaceae bacterium]|jgi:protein phosphatase|nr:protein phosphatase 2C domain-containing protein [Gemmatimonadaceae bacterium]